MLINISRPCRVNQGESEEVWYLLKNPNLRKCKKTIESVKTEIEKQNAKMLEIIDAIAEVGKEVDEMLERRVGIDPTGFENTEDAMDSAAKMYLQEYKNDLFHKIYQIREKYKQLH